MTSSASVRGELTLQAQLAIGFGALIWLSLVALVFGDVEARWLMGGLEGYQVIGLGIFVVDVFSAALYWIGWTLRAFVLSMVAAVVVTFVCALAVGGSAGLPAAGILAAPVLVHSAAMSAWLAHRFLFTRLAPGRSRVIEAAWVGVGAGVASIGIDSMGSLPSVGASLGLPPSASAIPLLIGAGGGALFWLGFVILGRRIDASGNEQLQHVLLELIAPPNLASSDMTQPPEHAVFVAYVREDTRHVERLTSYLEGEGLAVFWDRKLKVGEVWKEVLHRGIRTAARVIVCFSDEVVRQTETEFYAELREMIDRARNVRPGAAFLLPVRLSDCVIPDIRIDATTTLSSIQHLDLFPESRWNEAMQELTEVLRS